MQNNMGLIESMDINIVIPMAGAGMRFSQAGYPEPKPFIPLLGKPMILHVVDNIGIPGATYIFICQKKHLEKYGTNFQEELRKRNFIKDFRIIEIDGITEGAACTVLKSEPYINSEKPLYIINSDQLVGEQDLRESVSHFIEKKSDGGIMCFFARHPKWSYAGLTPEGLIDKVIEKQVISDHATVGMYYFGKGADFVAAAKTMIDKNDRVNNEFYVAPTYNYLIKNGKSVHPYFINKMTGLGTPEDLDKHLLRKNNELLLISHRGNLAGPRPELENRPEYVLNAIHEGFDCEVDVWFDRDAWWLGHDAPQYPVTEEFLLHPKLWRHAKNPAAFELMKRKGMHCFWHQNDFCTITSRGISWYYPSKTVFPAGINVLPEQNQLAPEQFAGCLGVCSDYVQQFRKK